MMPGVLLAGHEFKILKVIVALGVILVVDGVTWRYKTISLLPDVLMFGKSTSCDLYIPVRVHRQSPMIVLR